MSPRKVIAIAGNGVRLMTRDWSNLFFLFVFPLVLIMVIGLSFGGGHATAVGVVAPGRDPLAAEVVHNLEGNGDLDVHHYGSEAGLRQAVEQGHVDGGVVVPAGYGASLRAGRRAEVAFLVGPNGVGAVVRPAIDEAVRAQSIRVQAARFAAAHGGGGFDATLARVTALSRALHAPRVVSHDVGDTAGDFEGLGQFDLGASQELLLFMFVSGIAGSAALIRSRQLGVSRRMLSTPTSSGTVLAGEALSRFTIILVQGVYIMLTTWTLFDVNWGDPVGAILVLVLFALVTTGVAVLAGALFRNDQQASSVGVFLGLGLGALGGCMVPLDLFTGGMKAVAHITPHAWGNLAFAELVRRHGSVADILPDLAVLAGMAAVLLTLATWRLRKVLTAA